MSEKPREPVMLYRVHQSYRDDAPTLYKTEAVETEKQCRLMLGHDPKGFDYTSIVRKSDAKTLCIALSAEEAFDLREKAYESDLEYLRRKISEVSSDLGKLHALRVKELGK